MVSAFSMKKPFSTKNLNKQQMTLVNNLNISPELSNHNLIKIKSELSWSQLVHAEIMAVTSAMRKNTRIMNGSKMGSLGHSMGLRNKLKDSNIKHENSLMEGFINLRTYIETILDVQDIDTVHLLKPFLDVIQSTNKTVPVAISALESVEKLFHYGIIGLKNPRVSIAINTLSSAATQCKSDDKDELISICSLNLLQTIVTTEVGQVLSDESICEIIEGTLKLCCDIKYSDMMKKTSSQVMINMIIAIFERLKGLDDEWQLVDSLNTEQDSNDLMEPFFNNPTHLQNVPQTDQVVENPLTEESNYVTIESNTSRPYGIPAIRELLRVLINLINPYDTHTSNSVRLVALNILNVAFEVGGKSIGRFESLRQMVTEKFCKYVFQLSTSTHSIPLLSLSLRTISTVFDTLRTYLKNQQESFIIFLMKRLSKGCEHLKIHDERIQFVLSKEEETKMKNQNAFLKSTDTNRLIEDEKNELFLEFLVQICRKPSFMVDLWYNYDCDLISSDLAEEVIQYLCKNSFPKDSVFTNSNILCLDTVVYFINQMVDRLNHENSDDEYVVCELVSIQDLEENKKQKRLILEGSGLFNESPKRGIQFFIDHDLVQNEPHSISKFLRSTRTLDKGQLGDFLGRPEQIEILKAYLELFDFRGKRMDEGLRMVLNTFRLPGEAQQIMRVVECFAPAYLNSAQPDEIATQEAAEVLAYSIILLNTDQYSPQLKRESRMSLQDYIRNVRGVNDRSDFPRDYLVAIYKAIQKDEIVLSNPDDCWESSSTFVQCDTASLDSSVFELGWKPVVAAIRHAFMSAQDDVILEKTMTGFRQCARLASQFRRHDVFQTLISSLMAMTGLLVEHETVGSLAVQLGCDYKAQLATVILFSIVREHKEVMDEEGWVEVLRVVRQLFLHGLLPASMVTAQDFVSGTTTIQLKSGLDQPLARQSSHRRDLLNTLSSYLPLTYPTDENELELEVEYTLCAIDCIKACQLEDLLNINASNTNLIELFKAIRAIGYDTTRMKSAESSIPYDPVTVLFLEWMVTITVNNSDQIEDLWPYVTEYIFGILSFVDKQNTLVIERTMIGLLRLCICCAKKKHMLNEIMNCLRVLSEFPKNIIQVVAEQLMAGIYNLSSANHDNRENTEFLNIILEIKQKVASSL